jgi:hypothetical protein
MLRAVAIMMGARPGRGAWSSPPRTARRSPVLLAALGSAFGMFRFGSDPVPL